MFSPTHGNLGWGLKAFWKISQFWHPKVFTHFYNILTQILALSYATSKTDGLTMETLMDVRKKVSKLQLQKIELLVELENLKADAQKNLDCLEAEVQQLREQVKEFTELLDSL